MVEKISVYIHATPQIQLGTGSVHTFCRLSTWISAFRLMSDSSASVNGWNCLCRRALAHSNVL